MDGVNEELAAVAIAASFAAHDEMTAALREQAPAIARAADLIPACRDALAHWSRIPAAAFVPELAALKSEIARVIDYCRMS